MSNTNTGYDHIVTNSGEESGMNPLPQPSEEHKLTMKLNQIYMNEKDKREQEKKSRKKKEIIRKNKTFSKKRFARDK